MIDDAMKEAEAVMGLLKRPPPAMGYRVKPRLREEIRSLMRAIDGAVNAPTAPQAVRLTQLREEKAHAQAAFEAFMNETIAAVNEATSAVPQVHVATTD
jgi:hypothetical protein